MPYTALYQKKGKWCFKNKDTGQERCSDDKHDAVASMRVMYMVEGGKEATGKKGKPFRVRS